MLAPNEMKLVEREQFRSAVLTLSVSSKKRNTAGVHIPPHTDSHFHTLACPLNCRVDRLQYTVGWFVRVTEIVVGVGEFRSLLSDDDDDDDAWGNYCDLRFPHTNRTIYVCHSGYITYVNMFGLRDTCVGVWLGHTINVTTPIGISDVIMMERYGQVGGGQQQAVV